MSLEGEVIKEFPGGIAAVRWTCTRCAEDTVSIFEPGVAEKRVECDECEAEAVVRKKSASAENT
jgi:hypothetical protein